MRLHLVAEAAYVVPQLPPHRLESVANGDIHILVWTPDFQTPVPLSLLFPFQVRLMRDDEFLTRHLEFDAYMKWVTVSMVPMRRSDNHAATRDAAEILIELIRFLLDPSRHCHGCVHVSKGRLHWHHHDSLDVLSF